MIVYYRNYTTGNVMKVDVENKAALINARQMINKMVACGHDIDNTAHMILNGSICDRELQKSSQSAKALEYEMNHLRYGAVHASVQG